ncbi:MAG TPA: hypothetical protein VFT77_00815 [Reyranella sp.]|nr:hypothetical protein [Reyranella sp.]
MTVDDWTSVESEVGRIVAESDPPFATETIAHLHDFLKYLREKRTAAPKVRRGYWPTLNIWWEYNAAAMPVTTAQFEVFAKNRGLSVQRRIRGGYSRNPARRRRALSSRN